MPAFDVIAFDGDDTLWHNESIFSLTQEEFRALLQPYAPAGEIDARLFATETRNLALFGYGIKAFMLSMIETAIELTNGRIPASAIQTIIDHGKAMLAHPVELLPGVRETVERLAATHRLMLITKGDLFDQEGKIARSGLGDHFWRIEVVSEKDVATYRRVLARHEIAPERFVMIGNSLRSDILPVLEIGGRAVYIPYHLTWEHERVEGEIEVSTRMTEIEHIGELPDLVAELEGSLS